MAGRLVPTLQGGAEVRCQTGGEGASTFTQAVVKQVKPHVRQVNMETTGETGKHGDHR